MALSSCTSGIRNDLEYAVGRDQSHHDAFLGNPYSCNSNTQGKICTYELNDGKCKYDVYYDKNNIMTKYVFLSDYDDCKIPVKWGGPW